MTKAAAVGSDVRHAALIYDGAAEYDGTVAAYLRDGVIAREPMLLAMAQREPPSWLPELTSPLVVVSDMEELGRNPARLIPAMRAFADDHDGRRVRYLGETTWAGQSRAELRETCRHEALVNLAFAREPATILCAYDASRLPPQVIANARRTHPIVIWDGVARPSDDYLGPASFPADCDAPLSAPPQGARSLCYDQDLRPLRAFVAAAAARAGLDSDRATDLVLAASELAANTLRHTTGGGTTLLWRTGQEILCEIRDTGHITDPLAGRRAPANDRAGGQGLWLVNQVCDLVELRSSKRGTTVRLHMRLR